MDQWYAYTLKNYKPPNFLNTSDTDTTNTPGFPVAQMLKSLPAVRETQVWSLGWEDPLEKEMATQYSCLENSLDRGAWKVIVHGVAKGWTQLDD